MGMGVCSVPHHYFWNASGGSKEHCARKASSERRPLSHSPSEVMVAEAMPPSAESKISTTPSTAGAAWAVRRAAALRNMVRAVSHFWLALVTPVPVGANDKILTDFPRSGAQSPG